MQYKPNRRQINHCHKPTEYAVTSKLAMTRGEVFCCAAHYQEILTGPRYTIDRSINGLPLKANGSVVL